MYMYIRKRRGPSTIPCGTSDSSRRRCLPIKDNLLIPICKETLDPAKVLNCLWCQSDGAGLQGDDLKPYQRVDKRCSEAQTKLQQLASVSLVHLRGRIWWC